MHITTYFNCKEQSSGYSMKHNIYIYIYIYIYICQVTVHIWDPKRFTWKNTGKVVTKLLS